MPKLIIEDRRADPQPVRVSCGCFGCLTSALALIALGWMAFHISDIIAFVTS